MSGGLVMAVFRFKTDDKGITIKDDSGRDVKVPVADFSYQNDSLAQMIVDAWTSDEFRERLLKKENAKSLLAERGIFLQNPVIIDEATYWNDAHTKDRDDEVVFVLPDRARVGTPRPGYSLLETARLLMACVPNGI
jgi:hypothetical protein